MAFGFAGAQPIPFVVGRLPLCREDQRELRDLKVYAMARTG
jgi:hypothetical protein